MREPIRSAKRWVIKIGSTLLSDSSGLNNALLRSLSGQISQLLRCGHQVIVVSSGAIAQGMRVLNMPTRPSQLHRLQALAAIGQMRLVRAWERCFKEYGYHTAQVLLTHAEMSNRERYINARVTLNVLLEMGVVPVVNENDVIANEEICFGDNDTLAALAVTLVEADILVILTDQKGMYDRNPDRYPYAQLLEKAAPFDIRLDAMAGKSANLLGSGGMITKLRAARQCARAGAHTVIAPGREQRAIERIAAGERIGTWLTPSATPVAARKRWLLGQLKTEGSLVVDSGAYEALKREASLLPVGVKSCSGAFHRGDLVRIVHDGAEVGRGLSNYNASDSRRICGSTSRDIERKLGYAGQEEIIHKDNLVLNEQAERRASLRA